MKIYVSTEDKFKNDNRYTGTYLHGKMETEYGYDIFSFSRKKKFETGVHNFTIRNKNDEEVDVTFFLWKAEQPSDWWRGFLIYTKDEKAYRYCLESYRERKQNI
tara:strand:- start:7737 stop:8048 length:312 start_codon:yes stop_codon:yes gene_type:complete